MATSTLTWTFPTDPERDSFWQDYCDNYQIAYTDATDAEDKGLAEIKAQVAQALAGYRAGTEAETAKVATYDAEFADLSGY